MRSMVNWLAIVKIGSVTCGPQPAGDATTGAPPAGGSCSAAYSSRRSFFAISAATN